FLNENGKQRQVETQRTRSLRSLVDMHHRRRRKAIEMRTAGRGVGADVLAVEVFAQVEVRKLLGQADRVEGVAGGAEDGADLRGTLFEALEMVLAVVEDDPAEGVVDAVIEVVTEFAAPDCLADDLDQGRGRGGHEEAPRFGKDLDRVWKEPVQ